MDGENQIYVKQSNQFIKRKYENEENVGIDRDEYLIGYQICDVPVIKNDYESGGEMEIFIKTIDDKILTFEMEHSNKIRDVKMKIHEKIKLSADKQNLIFQGEILNDDKTIDEYQIYEKSVIDIIAQLRGGMRIFVKTMNGITIAFEVQKSDKIVDVKYKIQKKMNWNRDEQKLIYQGEILNEDKTIDEYQIVEKSVIIIDSKLRPGGMQIFAKTMDGKTVAFQVQKSDRIIDIKYKIQDKTGLHPDVQKFVYKGGILEDHKTIDEYQICEKSVIDIVTRLRLDGMQIFDKSMIDVVARNRMKIFVKTMSKMTIAFVVERTERVIDIKYKIQDKIGLHADKQELIYNGGILEDDKTIDEYDIYDGDVINVCARLSNYCRHEMKIFAKTIDGKTVAFEVEKSNKIIDIKYKIQEKIGLHPDKQILFYQDEILNDDKTVDEYQIFDLSVIDVVTRLRLLLVVKTINGKTIALEVQRSDKIIDIRKKIQEKLGLQNEKQLIYEGRLLNDEKTIYHYQQICDKSVINIDA